MGWIAENVTPVFRTAEQAVAGFWNSTTDESKASILIGILASIGAAFAALAIPVMAAVWPFLAVGAAIFLLYELFQEFQHWLDGSAKTIFDNLFGSFDEFEKRYPAIVKGLRALIDATGGASNSVNKTASGGDGDKPSLFNELATPSGLFGNAYGFLKSRGNNFNPLPGIEKFFNLFVGGDDSAPTAATGLTPPAVSSGAQTNINNTNSGNTTIQVATPEDAATVANKRDAAFVGQMGSDIGNMAEGGGYL
jgi:hypothetical protein